MREPVKVHKEYDDLIELLESRGMLIPDRGHAIKKITQVGYYRLSGFWYPCRLPKLIEGVPDGRIDTVRPGTSFRDIYDLYLFDKNLRLLMMDALERIEVYVRSVIAHEIGRDDPLAYLDNSYINPTQLKPRTWRDDPISARDEWLRKYHSELRKCKEESITWHTEKYEGIPFWVAIEVWDFGLMSKYFAMLKDKYRNKILVRMGISKGNGVVLQNWLSAMNVLRNRCAHHSRIWNKVNEPKIMPLSDDPYFEALNLDLDACQRIYGMISVLWFILKKIGPGSQWINNVADLVDGKPTPPNCYLTAMGFPDNSGFPRHLFGI
ncbi:TPA: Abi family protein [Citrobacter freundii]|uniref:Abi family protein n=1 Tax=Citrobacter freundii TaxID=546 RepID=UPI0024336657|nr:Abi family protein [Citrobacter freundii]WFY90588.1 Abi family protein [Citrobacter freundii]